MRESGPEPPEGNKSQRPYSLRMVFSLAGRYSRDVLVDNVVTISLNGRCEPIAQ